MKLTKEDTATINKIHQLITEKPGHNFTIEKLADNNGINREKLKYGFKELYEVGVYQYQLQQRIMLALELLEDKDKSIKYIASKCGYAGNNSFSRAFKNMMNLTPTEWRNNKNAKAS